MTFDVDALRRLVPALALTHEGRAMAFFDGPGGTQVPQAVIDAVTQTLVPAIKNAELKSFVLQVAPAFQGHLAAAKKLAGKYGAPASR